MSTILGNNTVYLVSDFDQGSRTQWDKLALSDWKYSDKVGGKCPFLSMRFYDPMGPSGFLTLRIEGDAAKTIHLGLRGLKDIDLNTAQTELLRAKERELEIKNAAELDVPMPKIFVGTADPDADDPVLKAKHYQHNPSGVECIQVIRHMTFNIGTAVKYLWRAGLKGDIIEDLNKAIYYIKNEIIRLGGTVKD